MTSPTRWPHRFARIDAIWCRCPPFRADLSRGVAALMEDQAILVVGEIGERQFRLGTRQADRADEEAKAVLLMREDMLDPGADG